LLNTFGRKFGILDRICDFGRTENEIFDSVFVQSLDIVYLQVTAHFCDDERRRQSNVINDKVSVD